MPNTSKPDPSHRKLGAGFPPSTTDACLLIASAALESPQYRQSAHVSHFTNIRLAYGLKYVLNYKCSEEESFQRKATDRFP